MEMGTMGADRREKRRQTGEGISNSEREREERATTANELADDDPLID